MKLNTVDGKAYLTLVIFCDKVCWWKLTEHRCFHPGFLVLSTNKTDTHDLRVTKILIKYYDLITGTNLCSTNNGGCEQLCFAYPNETTAVCACATGNLAADNKTCEGNFFLSTYCIIIFNGIYSFR